MRITCPNCSAQYDVGDDLIPSEGRDVQCSNCGTTWFQDGRPRAATAVEERAVRRPGRTVPPEMDPEPDADEVDASEETEQVAAPVRRRDRPRRPTADDETLNILREERAREERLRAETADDAQTDADQVDETDDDAEDEDLDPRQQAAAERARMAAAASLARSRGDGAQRRRGARAAAAEVEAEDDADVSDVIAETLRDAATPATEDDDSGDEIDPFAGAGTGGAVVSARSARRELLPDIEEINSSLRPDERAAEAEALANAEAEAPMVARRMSGFRIGFLVVSFAVLMLVGVYVFADTITGAVPQVTSLVADYVAWVDAKRVALASAAETLTDSIAPDT